MPENLQPEELELAAAELDTWITARFAGRERLAALADLNSQTINLTALAQDLLSLAESIQPDHDFVLNLEASLRRKVLTKHRSPCIPLTILDNQPIEDNHKDR